MNRQEQITRYLKISEWVKKRYTVDGELVLAIGGKPSSYSQIESAAYKRYVLDESKEMSQETFLKAEGSVCPKCRSVDIEMDDINLLDGKHVLDLWCLSCDDHWKNLYKLEGFVIEQR